MDLDEGTGLKLDVSLIPKKLHWLVPFVERWGWESLSPGQTEACGRSQEAFDWLSSVHQHEEQDRTEVFDRQHQRDTSGPTASGYHI